MQMARVCAHVVVTRRHEAYTGRKLLHVQPVGRDRADQGEPLVAIDLVDAGAGDLVLVTSEGRWARERFGRDAPVRSLVVAVIEGVEFQP